MIGGNVKTDVTRKSPEGHEHDIALYRNIHFTWLERNNSGGYNFGKPLFFQLSVSCGERGKFLAVFIFKYDSYETPAITSFKRPAVGYKRYSGIF